MDLAVGIGAGVVTGIGSSFTVWWWLTRYMRPVIEWSPYLALDTRSDPPTVRVRAMNLGKRPVIDVEATWRVRVAGLKPDAGTTYIELNQGRAAMMLPRGDGGRGYSWLLDADRLVPESLARSRHYLPPEIVQKLDTDFQTLTLLYFIGPDSELAKSYDVRLLAFIFGTDSYSGARSFVKAEYRASNMVEGLFSDFSLDVMPLEQSGT